MIIAAKAEPQILWVGLWGCVAAALKQDIIRVPLIVKGSFATPTLSVIMLLSSYFYSSHLYILLAIYSPEMNANALSYKILQCS